MDRPARTLLIIVILSPFIAALLYCGGVMAITGTVFYIPGPNDPPPTEVITWNEVREEGIRPILLPICIGIYVYVLAILFVIVATRKAD